MATKYVSSLTGPEMDSALTDMAYHNSEAYAVGTRNGIPVGSSDVTYHNNSKYWAEQVYGYTDRAEDAANRAEAAVPSGTAGAVFFDRAQTLTSAQQSQARANIMAGGSNRNLLDNPWFTVNQRGQSSYTGLTWGVDRWTFSGADSNHKITINADKTVTIQGLFYEKKEYDFAVGDIVTISYMLADGTVVSKTGTISNSQGFAVGNSEFGFYWRPNGIADFQIWAASALRIRAVKLEKGSVSTLANDAPPNYAEELRKCQYYFQRIKGVSSSYAMFGLGMVMSTSTASILLPLPAPMRNATLTVSYSGRFGLLARGATTSGLEPTGMTYYDKANGGVRINITFATQSNIETYGLVMLQGYSNANSYIDLSAEL